MTIILGIDPGSRCTGVGIIEADRDRYRFVFAGQIKTVGTEVAPRLHHIYQGLRDFIAMYQPAEVAIEKIFMHVNPGSALLLGQARGAALVAVGTECSLSEYTARQVKEAVVGYGNATKEQVQHMVKSLLSLTERVGPDASDALAIALCHANCRSGLGAYVSQLKGMRRGRAR